MLSYINFQVIPYLTNDQLFSLVVLVGAFVAFLIIKLRFLR